MTPEFKPGDIAVCTHKGQSDRVTIIAFDREYQLWLVQSLTDRSVRGLAEASELSKVDATQEPIAQ